jgi:hypothetical protein
LADISTYYFYFRALGLFGGEIGESIRLTDDISNDLVEVSAPRSVQHAESGSPNPIIQSSVAVAEEIPLHCAIVPLTRSVSSSFSDLSASNLLHVLPVQRK